MIYDKTTGINNRADLGENRSLKTSIVQYRYTMFENKNERQKTKQVPSPLPRASRNFPDVKTRNDFFFIIGLWR